MPLSGENGTGAAAVTLEKSQHITSLAATAICRYIIQYTTYTTGVRIVTHKADDVEAAKSVDGLEELLNILITATIVERNFLQRSFH